MFLLCFLRYQYENKRLPPSSAAFYQKVLRMNYTVMQWKSSHLARPMLGSPSQHDWVRNYKNGVYDPVMTELGPVPESIAELSICKCTTGCLTQRCKCKKNGFVFSDLCHYIHVKTLKEICIRKIWLLNVQAMF